mmetsp:Transcript_57891/g.122822  ORF Transcript_57891/g.122822 Transcript_57891/m.122822 type:complete len:96 (-) Transcript_57891:554-841(-)
MHELDHFLPAAQLSILFLWIHFAPPKLMLISPGVFLTLMRFYVQSIFSCAGPLGASLEKNDAPLEKNPADLRDGSREKTPADDCSSSSNTQACAY